MINSLSHISFIVADTGKALTFYRDVLGFTQNYDRPDLGYPGAWLDMGDLQIHLLELPNPDPVTGRPEHGGRDRHVAFNISDVNQLMQQLTENHITFSTSRSGRKAIFCRDPDGNALEFIECNS